MRLHELDNLTYLVRYRRFSKYTGVVYIVEPSGIRYKAHHTDLVRM